MAHHIYQTEAIILKHDDYGESAKIFTLLTKDIGVVRASAQGIRHGVSKLRYHTSLFSHVSISLVKGKEWWRITSISNSEVVPVFAQKMFARIADLLTKITDEGSMLGDNRTYNNLRALHAVIKEKQNFAIEEYISECEVLAVYRLLHALGYIDASSHTELISVHSFDEQMLIAVRKDKKNMVTAINTGIASIGIR